MKKILYLFAAMLMLSACDDKAETVRCTDMMFFFSADDIENASGSSDYGSSYVGGIKYAEIAAGESLELVVLRSVVVAEQKYATQTASLLVGASSTASVGADFEISTTSLRFGKGQHSLPVTVTAKPSAAGKTIVLKLDYGYADVCPKEGRKADVLTITVR